MDTVADKQPSRGTVLNGERLLATALQPVLPVPPHQGNADDWLGCGPHDDPAWHRMAAHFAPAVEQGVFTAAHAVAIVVQIAAARGYEPVPGDAARLTLRLATTLHSAQAQLRWHVRALHAALRDRLDDLLDRQVPPGDVRLVLFEMIEAADAAHGYGMHAYADPEWRAGLIRERVAAWRQRTGRAIPSRGRRRHGR